MFYSCLTYKDKSIDYKNFHKVNTPMSKVSSITSDP